MTGGFETLIDESKCQIRSKCHVTSRAIRKSSQSYLCEWRFYMDFIKVICGDTKFCPFFKFLIQTIIKYMEILYIV